MTEYEALRFALDVGAFVAGLIFGLIGVMIALIKLNQKK